MKLLSQMEPSSACSYVATQRGGVALLFEGHRYNKVRDGKDGTVYWRCSRDRQCPGRAVTVNNRVKKSNNKHNHPPEASLLMRNGSGGSHHSSNSSSNRGHHSTSSNSTSTAMAAAAAAAAAYASFLQGSNTTKHSKSSQSSNSIPTTNTSQSRPPPHNSPSTASSSSPSPVGLSTTGSANNALSSAFSFLQNLTTTTANTNHLLNNQAFFSHDNGRQVLNLSTPNRNVDSNPSSRVPFNHFNLFNHHRASLESPLKLSPNSPPPTPTSTSGISNSLLFSKTLQSQYNNLLKSQFNATNNNTLDLSSSSFLFGLSPQHSSSNASSHIKNESQTNTSPPMMASHQPVNLTGENANPNLAAFMLQDAFQEAQAAAVAAAAFPSILSETFKYIAATASTNPQMAAALATTLTNPNMMKNFDLTMATAAAAAVAAAANSNCNGDSVGGGINKSSHDDDDLVDHSPFAALRLLTGGMTCQRVTQFKRHQ